MTRDEFCKFHWEYYLVLEKDVLRTEQYVSFELGDNYLYAGKDPENPENSLTFSNEYVKQYQAICSEVDVIMKSICRELGNTSAENMTGYTEVILTNWNSIKMQKVRMRRSELQPFLNWEKLPAYKSPDWWKPYNNVKHERLCYYKMANLKNVLNALAGLYILENYLVKYIGDRDQEIDVPNDISGLFEMVNYLTENIVRGKYTYALTKKDIDAICGF